MSSSLFHNLPITKEKVTSVIAKLKTNLGRNPTEDEIAADLNISKEELQRFKPPSSETRYYGSSLAEHNRPSGPVFMDPLRYERNLHGYETPTGLLYNDPNRIAALSILQGKKGGQSTRNLKKNKNKHKKTSSRQRRHHSKKNKKSMKRK
jgi:hypothetical protein